MDTQPILPTHTPTTTPVKSEPQSPSQQHSLLQPIRTQSPTQNIVKIAQEIDRSLSSFSEKQKDSTSVSGKTEKSHSRARHAPRSPPPEICIQDWSTVGINMADLYIPTSILPPPGSWAASSSNSPSSPSGKSPEPPSLATPFTKSLTSPTRPAPPESCTSDSEPPSVAAESSEQTSPNPSSSTVSASDPPSSKLPNNDADDPKSSVATENIMIKSEEPSTPTPSVSFVAGCSKALPLTAYATSAVSAMSSYFWDPSPAETDEAHRIPPLYSSSPPRRQYLSHDTSNSPQLLGRLPYPELFDFSMYISESPSGDSIYSISMNCATNPLQGSDSSGMSTSGGSPQRDSYRSAAFSRTLSSLRQSPFTLRKSVVLMQAIKQQATQPNASFGSSTCKETTHDFDVSMDSSTEDRLQEACAGLSRGEWTPEEFLKLLTEV
ncbi:hypothetical protein IW262DRAFT_1497219 [Armillaria fumosa]|nr:hypothetical protein IW262DRAFT_1497219 [Armillaria fumosa]